MRALVYVGPHDLVVQDEPDPLPVGGEALVRVEAVGICGSDMHAYHGHDDRRPAPLILGHEAAGRALSGPLAGRRVAVNPLVVDPACPFALEGRPHLSPSRQIISMPPRAGAFAELVRIPNENLVPIPDNLDIARASLAEPLAVALHAARRGLALLFGSVGEARCVVLGGGAIGLACGLVLAMEAAGAVQVGESSAARRRTLERSGLAAYDPAAGEPDAGSADLVIDAVGAVSTRAAASRLVRPGGVIVHAGLLPGLEGFDVRRITLQEITVTGTYCYTPHDFRRTVEAMVAGRLGALDWFEERPLADGARAFADIDAGTVAAAKIVLRP